MNLPDIIQLPLRFDAIRLKKELRELIHEKWIPHFNQHYYSGEWSVIPLRTVNGQSDHIYPDPSGEKPFENTPLMECFPYVKKILASLKCEKESVRFMRLSAKSKIKEHQDLNLSYKDGTFRIHIPIITNLKVTFFLDGMPVHMKKGECWYLNFNQKHSVINDGDTERIHLVIDCKANSWTDMLFKSYTYSQKEKFRTQTEHKLQQTIEDMDHIRSSKTTKQTNKPQKRA